MEDIFDGAWRERFVARDPAVEAELARLIDIHGPTLIEQSSQLRQALVRASPDAQRHVAVLLAALSAGVAERLRAAEDDPDVPGLLERCVADLQAHGVVDPEWAWWAVRTWAHAFALPSGQAPSPSTVPSPAISQPPAGSSEPRSDAAEIAVPPAVVARTASAPVARARRDPSVAPWIVDAEAAADVAVAPEREAPASRARGPVEPVLFPKGPGSAPPIFAIPPEEPDPPMFAVPEPDPVPPMFVDSPADAAAVEPIVEPSAPEPVLQVEPLFTDRDLKRLSRDEPGFVAASPLPPASRIDSRPAGTAGRGRRTLVVALLVGLPLGVLLGFLASRWIGTPQATTTVTTAPPATAPVPAAVAKADAPSAAVSTDATPPAPRDEPSPATTPSQPGATSSDAPAAAAPVEPARAQAPTAAPPTRPIIAGIEAPRIVQGAPFVVVVEIAGDAKDVAAIERRYVDRVGAWPRDSTVTGANLKRAGNALLVRFGPVKAPAMATVEFTAVLRDGTRSEPRAVTLALAARGDRDGSSTTSSCTQSTCGSVIETREVAPDSRFQTPLYAVVVQLDDHERFTYTAPYRPPVGTRMRRTGTSFTPAS